MSLSAEAIAEMVERITLSVANQLRQEFHASLMELRSQPGPSVESTVAIDTIATQLRQAFQASLSELRQSGPSVQKYEEISISKKMDCNLRLDLPKSMPDFNGAMERYPFWRQSAKAAIKPYEGYLGSEIYYQAVAIIRNKVTGSADMVLSSFSTPLNFEAILA